MSRKKFLCLDCNIDTGRIGEFYYLKEEIWNSVAPKVGMLCIDCLEKRLKRKLKSSDFDSCFLNSLKFGQKSAKLIDRLTSKA